VEAVELAVFAAIKAKLFASYGVGRTVYDPLKVMPPTVVGTLTVKAEFAAYPWFGKSTLIVGELFVVVKYGTWPEKLAVCVPEPAVDVLINAPVGVDETLNVVELTLRTKYVAPTVRPVGNAPVVVNITTVPDTGAAATVTTAGEAFVIVAACAVV